MSEVREKYIESLLDASKSIMDRCVKDGGSLTDSDIMFLKIFKKELTRYENVPVYTKIISGAKSILSFINKSSDEGDKE